MEKEPEIDTDLLILLDFAEDYLDDVERRFTKKTYEEKKYAFKSLLSSISPDTPVEDISPADALKYLQKQADTRSGYAANRDRKNLSAAWNWGRKFLKGFPDIPNPFLAVDRFPEERTPRYIPPEEDFWKVLDIADGQDAVMLQVFLYLAARRSEVFNLTWSDVDFDNNRVRLWTKKRVGGSREPDWLPMTSELRAILMNWWQEREVKNHTHVFLCLEKTPFCQEYYGQPFRQRRHFMKRLCKRAGVKPFGFHAIRHLTASILYSRGEYVATIQSVLRHKNPNTTARYLHSLGLEHTREALEGLSRDTKVVPLRKRAENE